MQSAPSMSFRRIAALLGVSYTTAYRDYRRALDKLGLDYTKGPRRIRRRPRELAAA